jgi:catechol 2,3-dioxygenase-like lactoylglutathione lyase family enzyme
MAARKKSKKAMKALKKAKKLARKAGRRSGQVTKATKVTKKKAAPKAAKKAAAPRKPARKARRQPETLRLRSAGPSFTVNDLQKSLAFYRDVLGFTVKENWEENGVLRGVELVAGSVSFWLGQDDWKKGRDRVKGQGFRMYCGTTQDVDALARQIEAGGGTLVEKPTDRPWGGRDFAVVDPDGFTITISTGL